MLKTSLSMGTKSLSKEFLVPKRLTEAQLISEIDDINRRLVYEVKSEEKSASYFHKTLPY